MIVSSGKSALTVILLIVSFAANAQYSADFYAKQLATEWARVDSDQSGAEQSAVDLQMRIAEKKTGISKPNHPWNATWLIYDLYAKDAPKDKTYTLWLWKLGDSPRATVTGLAIDDSGKIVCAPSRSEQSQQASEVPLCNSSEPFQLTLDAAKGEPKRLAVVSTDQKVKAFTRIIPFPKYGMDGGCTLYLEMLAPVGKAFLVRGYGFAAGEEIDILSQSEQEVGHFKIKANKDGAIRITIYPVVKGKTAGSAEITATSTSCAPYMRYVWGTPASTLQ